MSTRHPRTGAPIPVHPAREGATPAERRQPPEPGTAVERDMRAVLDVSDLPTVVYGSRGLVWWGTVGFMVVEGVTLAICIASYFYLWRNFASWPPYRTPNPDLLVPTLGLLVLLGSMVPAYFYHRASERLDKANVQRWLWVDTLVTAVALALRFVELDSINVRWDDNAYGSVVWAIVISHLTLLLVSVFETGTMATMFSTDREQPKHYSDVADNAMYTYFMALAWLPCYVIIYLVPRFT